MKNACFQQIKLLYLYMLADDLCWASKEAGEEGVDFFNPTKIKIRKKDQILLFGGGKTNRQKKGKSNKEKNKL